MPLTELNNKIKKAKKVLSISNFKQIVIDIFNSGLVTDDTIKIVQDRLYNKGTDANNDKLITDHATSGFYSPTTIGIKKDTGKRFKNVTLNDTGDFYRSFDDFVSNKGFELTADFNKSDGHIYNNFTESYNSHQEFEKMILSLTTEEKSRYIKTVILPEFLLYLKQDLKNI